MQEIQRRIKRRELAFPELPPSGHRCHLCCWREKDEETEAGHLKAVRLSQLYCYFFQETTPARPCKLPGHKKPLAERRRISPIPGEEAPCPYLLPPHRRTLPALWSSSHTAPCWPCAVTRRAGGDVSFLHLQVFPSLGICFTWCCRDTLLPTWFASELLNLPGLCRPGKSLHHQAGINILERISPSSLPSTQLKLVGAGFPSATDCKGENLTQSQTCSRC